MTRLEFAKKLGRRVSRGQWERITTRYSVEVVGRSVVLSDATGEYVSVRKQRIAVDGPKKARKEYAKTLGLNPKKV